MQLHLTFQFRRFVGQCIVLCILASISKGQEAPSVNASSFDHGIKPLVKTRYGFRCKSAVRDDYTIHYSKDFSYYKLINKNGIIIREGTLAANSCENMGMKMKGKWIERYENGVIKSIQHYGSQELPIGLVEKYYQNGYLQEKYSFVEAKIGLGGVCVDGPYEEYYSNGKLKIKGNYKIGLDSTITDTIYAEDPTTGEQHTIIEKGKNPHSLKTGQWLYFNDKGDLLKRENY